MGFWRNLLGMTALAALAGPPAAGQRATPEQREAALAEVGRFNSPTLTRFRSEEEFRRYLGAVMAANRARYGAANLTRPVQLAALHDAAVQSDSVDPICPDSDPDCGVPPPGENGGEIVVSAQRVGSPSRATGRARAANPRASRPTNANITNNQMEGVDEGDIVKQIGHYLLVLQDGRIFVVDTSGGGERRLALADRMNVYRNPRAQMWYDEMLVFGDRVLVTGYSYAMQATELSVFRLDMASGRLSRQGVFFMSSNDYYSRTNYATRLIGDNLVVYTPFSVQGMAWQGFKWPVVRRWIPGRGGDNENNANVGRPLFDATQIYRPVRTMDHPMVHTVSVCPLGEAGPDRDLECRATAFVGPQQAQFYVTERDAFLWTNEYAGVWAPCPLGRTSEGIPAMLYRVPVSGAAPGVVGTRGVPPDQFSLDSRNGRFRALLNHRPGECVRNRTRLAFFDLPLRAFSATFAEAGGDRYTPLPDLPSPNIANRFTENYLVYGSLGPYPRGWAMTGAAPAYVVPVARPAGVRALAVRHSVLRAEQAGTDIVLTGYGGEEGLTVTLIDLDGPPRIASQVQLERRFESEGRSHAFNSLIEEDGSGVMGLPTVGRRSLGTRAPWRSSASDLSFLTVDPRGRLAPVGELTRGFAYSQSGTGIPGYTCEVSCIDWYGNSRPIFTDGRLFALTGTEIIEGRIRGGQVREVQRLNIALSVPRRGAAR